MGLLGFADYNPAGQPAQGAMHAERLFVYFATKE
jgi:hypothetical protein